MERDEFFHRTKNMLTSIDEILVGYSMGDQLTGHEATELWMQLDGLTAKFANIVCAAQAKDPALWNED